MTVVVVGDDLRRPPLDVVGWLSLCICRESVPEAVVGWCGFDLDVALEERVAGRFLRFWALGR